MKLSRFHRGAGYLSEGEQRHLTLPVSQIVLYRRSFNGALADVESGRGSHSSGPLEVWITEDGRYLLVDGLHRFVEGILHGVTSFNVKVVGKGYTDYYASPGLGEEWTPSVKLSNRHTAAKRYLRFGEIPEEGRSHNFARGTPEAGVSVYDVVERGGKWDIQVPEVGEWATDDLLDRMRDAFDAPMYLVTGDEAGVGGDGEPVITNVQVIEPLTIDQIVCSALGIDNPWDDL